MMEKVLRIAVSTRALFNLERENEIFVSRGVDEYVRYQVEHESTILPKGAAFSLVEAFLSLNTPEERRVEIMIMSKNSAQVSLRIFNSIEAYGLDITRAAFTTGMPIAPYLRAYEADLYLSANEADVAAAISSGVAAGLIMTDASSFPGHISQIRIAFDGDAVLFSDESERIYQEQGVEAFEANEKRLAKKPLPEGPFAHLLKMISALQQQYSPEEVPIRTALVTARSAPAHERVIRTLRSWDVRIDEAFFLGGEDKSAVLQAFGAHIFFDDNPDHIKRASRVVLSARVVYPMEVRDRDLVMDRVG